MPAIVNHDEMRNKILDCFESLAYNTPISNISLRMVAKEMGTSHARLQYYFSGTDDMLCAFAQRVSDSYKELLISITQKCISGKFKTKEDFISLYVDEVFSSSYDEKYKKIFYQLYGLSYFNESIREILSKSIGLYYEQVKEMLRNIYHTDLDDAALTMVSVHDGIGLYSDYLKIETYEIVQAFMKIDIPNHIKTT